MREYSNVKLNTDKGTTFVDDEYEEIEEVEVIDEVEEIVVE